jgi:hypothetical protein
VGRVGGAGAGANQADAGDAACEGNIFKFDHDLFLLVDLN